MGEASVFLFSCAFVLIGIAVYIGRDLPPTDGLWRNQGGARTTFVASDGTPLRQRGEAHGAPIRLADLPPHVIQAVLAIEDRNFYHHAGINPLSVIRAFVTNTRSGTVVQGGSTITQQLAKNLFLSSKRTYKRKLQEVFLAFWLEQRFTKDEILTLYLNRVYFGGGAWGLDAASYRYFGKPAYDLSVAEGAVLAGLLKAPGTYAPHLRPIEAGQRARLVIDAMVDAGFLSFEQMQSAITAPVQLSEPRFAGAPYFVDYAAGEVKNIEARAPVDLVARTTLSPVLQTALEKGVAEGLLLTGLDQTIEIAAVTITADGAVRAMIGGRNYRQSQFNRAVQAQRQAGSAFKPFVYAAALEAGHTPSDRINDAPLVIGKWSPDNYDSRFFGEVTLSTGLARSLNAATVRLQERVGRASVRDVASRMGLDTTLSIGPALALGVDVVSPLTLARAYAPLTNGGYRVRLHAIASLETVDGQQIEIARDNFEAQALKLDTVTALNEMLRETVRSGTGRNAALQKHTAAGKTGTTQENKDAWFVGHAGGLVTAVWIGRDDNQSMTLTGTAHGDTATAITGGGAPAIIWREIMSRALDRQVPILAGARAAE